MPPARSLLETTLQLASRYGLGTLLAILLVYKLTTTYEAKLDALTRTVETQVSDQRVLKGLLLRICVNTSPGDRDAALCQAESGR